jgi:hypothetical protein
VNIQSAEDGIGQIILPSIRFSSTYNRGNNEMVAKTDLDRGKNEM